MTPSIRAKEFGASTLKEVAEFNGVSVQAMAYHFDNNPHKFDELCWQWAKKNHSQSWLLRNAFIDGCLCTGITEENAGNLAALNGYGVK